MSFDPAPHTQNAQAEPRRFGFEFELADIELEECAELIAEIFGGEITYQHSLKARIEDTELGAFKVELDARMVQDLAAKMEKEIPTHKGLVAWMGDAAGKIVPFEVVTPPLEFEQFDKLEKLRIRLQKMKAQGTKAAIVNAFGMHINVGIASEDVSYTRDILRAFLVLYPWLEKVMGIDFSRRVLTYIDPFPTDYLKQVLPHNYQPTWEEFISNYLEHNPTRNRALDLLPLFAHISPGCLDELKKSDRKLIKPRPAFHYRLPNCEIDNPEWRIATDWNRWVAIEQLAKDTRKLNAMTSDYLKFLNKPLRMFSSWPKILSKRYGFES